MLVASSRSARPDDSLRCISSARSLRTRRSYEKWASRNAPKGIRRNYRCKAVAPRRGNLDAAAQTRRFEVQVALCIVQRPKWLGKIPEPSVLGSHAEPLRWGLDSNPRDELAPVYPLLGRAHSTALPPRDGRGNRTRAGPHAVGSGRHATPGRRWMPNFAVRSLRARTEPLLCFCTCHCLGSHPSLLLRRELGW